MKVLTYVDLGKAFESLKKTVIEVEKQVKRPTESILDTGRKYAGAFGTLSAAVQCHIAANTDTNYGFVEKALKTPENGYSEAPTLLLYDQTHWDDIPDELFSKPNLHP